MQEVQEMSYVVDALGYPVDPDEPTRECPRCKATAFWVDNEAWVCSECGEEF